MHTHRLPWIQPAVALLLIMALSACGSVAPTPIPSFTAALAYTPFIPIPTLTMTATVPATAAATPEPTAATPLIAGPDVEFEGVHFTLPAEVASGVNAQVVSAEDILAETYPNHIGFNLMGYDSRNTRIEPHIRVYPVSELGQAGTEIAQELKELLVEQPAAILPGVGIPILPVRNAGQQITVQIEYMTLADGSGIRVLTQFAQDAGPIENEGLVYLFQGLTNDDAYYISALLPVSASFLPDHADDSASVPPVDGVPYPQFNSSEFNAEYASYQQAVMDKLNRTSAEEFTPSLSALDDLLESLQVELVAAPKASPPPGALSMPCLNALPTRLRVGLFAYVDPDPPLPNNVRSDAGRDNDLIGEIGPSQAMKIMDGPKCADGWVWWQVRALEIKLEGWTAEGDQQEYWLIPCALQAQCGP